MCGDDTCGRRRRRRRRAQLQRRSGRPPPLAAAAAAPLVVVALLLSDVPGLGSLTHSAPSLSLPPQVVDCRRLGLPKHVEAKFWSQDHG